jgi:hypothetical protein
LPYLNSVHSEFYAKGEAAVDAESGLLQGRPYGGVAVLWRKSLSNKCKPIVLDDERLIGLDVISDQGTKYKFVCVYLPYYHHENYDNYLFYLSKLKGFIDSSDTPFVYIFGDFNANSAGESEFYAELETLCCQNSLSIHDTEVLPDSSYTYISSAHGTTSWLDHIVTTPNGKSSISNTSILYGVTYYDHLPMLIEIASNITPVCIPRVASELFTFNWEKASSQDLINYFNCSGSLLSEIKLPIDVLTCVDSNCTNKKHVTLLDKFYCDIVKSLTQSAENCVPKSKGMSDYQIPG